MVFNWGFIFDRNGVLLVENCLVFSLEIIFEEINDLDDILFCLLIFMVIIDDECENFESKLKG